MKRATLEATDENILQSIADQIGNRNARVFEFIKTLDSINDNRFISLDARWGEGKTFYVRQIEKTLEYQTLKKFGTDDTKLKEMQPYFASTVLEDIDLENSYFPVYYNAWLYDNHADPLMSLLLVISKKSKKYIDTTRAKKLSNRFGEFFSSFNASVTFPGKSSIQGSIDGEKATNSLKNVDILEEVKTAEEIREEVKRILDEAIVEQAQKLVIFIDELDRCRPSFALEMLERLKHYFDDDRIIFVVSINKEQLTHTISNYYGVGFDSTGYLNKFFDLEANLPALQTYDTEIQVDNREHYVFKSISNALVKYYKLSRRDFLIYREKINSLDSCMIINDYSFEGTVASLFVPIIIILDMKNIEEKRRFINGESDFLKIMKMIPAGKNLYKHFVNDSSELSEEEKIEKGYARFKMVYDFLFADAEKDRELEINRNFKEKILECCGQMTLNS
ncbi:P-loop NTPase fold protein [Dorea sp.]|uniref:KAP family P-loop NTPase fold protein n=1 Tax=Dorea sp. TaxID=2040332 RepID=UPI00352992DA